MAKLSCPLQSCFNIIFFVRNSSNSSCAPGFSCIAQKSRSAKSRNIYRNFDYRHSLPYWAISSSKCWRGTGVPGEKHVMILKLKMMIMMMMMMIIKITIILVIIIIMIIIITKSNNNNNNNRNKNNDTSS